MLKRKLFRLGLLSYAVLIMSFGNTAQETLPVFTDTTITSNDSSISSEPLTPSLPEIRLNAKAAKYVKTYIKDYRITLVDAEKRSGYFTIMDSVLTQYNLPVELKYMAVVESNLKPAARSRVGAKGIWQLMPVTGRYLGLKITKYRDDRTNVYKSTVAAAKYLQQLYREFDDWLLAIAAYNAGSGNVRRAIRYSGSRNFWQLQNFLPLETRNHVKRFIGVHVYFEGKGGLTTLTKKETELHNKEVAELLAQQSEMR